MPFDPDEYLKESKSGASFDPDSYLAESKSRGGQAFLQSYGNTATLGYLPHAQAAFETYLMPDPNAKLDEELRAKGVQISQPGVDYVKSRDANIKRQEELAKENPVESGLGTGAGILASALLTPGVGPAATVGGRVAQGAKTGLALGAIANPGDTEGEITYDPMGRLKNAAIGGAVGTAAQGAVEAVGPLAKKVSEILKGKAELKATRALGRPTPTQADEMAKSGLDKELGRELLDQGAIPIFGTPKRIQKNVEALKEKTWANVESLLSKGGDDGLVDGAAVGIKLLDSDAYKLLQNTPGAEGTVSAIERAAETFAKSGQVSLKEAQKIKRSIDRQINYNRAIPDMTGSQEARLASRTGLRDEMDEAVASLGGKKGELKKAFKDHGRLETASDILEREIGRDQANRAISLTDTIAAAGGAATGNGLAGLALGALNKGGRTFGNSLQARGFDAVSKVLGNSPEVMQFAQKNPLEFQMLANRILNFQPSPLHPSKDPTDQILNDRNILSIFEKNPALINSVQDPKLREALEQRIKRGPAEMQNPLQRRLSQ